MPSAQRIVRGAAANGGYGAPLAVLILAAFVALALAPEIVASADGLRGNAAALLPPSASHALGTDALGRDVWARLVFGARTSLAVGLLATCIALVLGTVAGWLAARAGGWWDEAIMRGAEITDSVPALLLALLFVAVFEPGIWPIALVVGATGWLSIARLVRAELLIADRLPYMTAAWALGAGRVRFAVRHLAPEVFIPLLALLPFRFEGAVIVEAGLAFLGIEDSNRPSWGTMLRDAQSLLPDAWWLTAAPAVALALLLFGLAMLADQLRQLGDPRQQGAGSVRTDLIR